MYFFMKKSTTNLWINKLTDFCSIKKKKNTTDFIKMMPDRNLAFNIFVSILKIVIIDISHSLLNQKVGIK